MRPSLAQSVIKSDEQIDRDMIDTDRKHLPRQTDEQTCDFITKSISFRVDTSVVHPNGPFKRQVSVYVITHIQSFLSVSQPVGDPVNEEVIQAFSQSVSCRSVRPVSRKVISQPYVSQSV